MLSQIKASLENVVLSALHQNSGGLTASEIGAYVEKRWKRYSRRGIYKELQRLESEGILLRTGGIYSIRLAWLLSLQAQVDQMVEAASQPEALKLALPTRNKEIVITCSDLVRWDRVWTQLMLLLHTAFPRLPLFQWVPRYWFNWTHPGIQHTFLPAAEEVRDNRFSIIGGRTSLDFDCRSSISRTSATYSYKRSPFEHDRTHYINVIGDYLIMCTLDKRTANRIDEIYEMFKEPKRLPADTGKKLLAIKCKGTIRCAWAPQRTEEYRQIFLKFFGAVLNDEGEVQSARRGEFPPSNG